MEKTLATAGRAIDDAAETTGSALTNAGQALMEGAGWIGTAAVTAAYTAVEASGRFGNNVAKRVNEHGLLAVVVAPGPIALYGLAAGLVDTIEGR